MLENRPEDALIKLVKLVKLLVLLILHVLLILLETVETEDLKSMTDLLTASLQEMLAELKTAVLVEGGIPKSYHYFDF